MVDEAGLLAALGRAVVRGELVVGPGRQLVGVPGEVDVQRRHAHHGGILGQDEHEAVVLLDEAVHGASRVGAMEPVELQWSVRS